MKTIAFIGSAILIFFGVLFIWSGFSPQGSGANIIVGVVTVIFGLVIIFFTSRKSAQTGVNTTNVTLKIDMPGNTNLETMKCQSCGGNLTPDNVKMVAGAPVVTCPFCNTTYQLTEEPKW
jgi:hypothetical protein